MAGYTGLGVQRFASGDTQISGEARDTDDKALENSVSPRARQRQRPRWVQ